MVVANSRGCVDDRTGLPQSGGGRAAVWVYAGGGLRSLMASLAISLVGRPNRSPVWRSTLRSDAATVQQSGATAVQQSDAARAGTAMRAVCGRRLRPGCLGGEEPQRSTLSSTCGCRLGCWLVAERLPPARLLPASSAEGWCERHRGATPLGADACISRRVTPERDAWWPLRAPRLTSGTCPRPECQPMSTGTAVRRAKSGRGLQERWRMPMPMPMADASTSGALRARAYTRARARASRCGCQGIARRHGRALVARSW